VTSIPPPAALSSSIHRQPARLAGVTTTVPLVGAFGAALAAPGAGGPATTLLDGALKTMLLINASARIKGARCN
jgi:hypothetical protein